MLVRRPRYHPTAQQGWMSDPNGPVHWGDRYHVFYQHNPASSRWGLMHWGHLTSTDLVHWEDEGIALRPNPAGPDADGCWSGCIREVGGEAVAFYTGASGAGEQHAEVVMRAVAEDGLRGFRRDPQSAVVGQATSDALQHRDPFLLRWDDRWIMLQGTGLPGPGEAGAVVAWESADTVHWTPTGTIFSLPRGALDVETGPVWECPQLFELDGSWVLLVSIQLPGSPDPVCRHVVWFVGRFDGEQFTPEAHGLVDYGDVLYAPAVAPAPDGRMLMWAWLQESPAMRNTGAGRWSGAFAQVRALGVTDGRLTSAPVRESGLLLGQAAASTDLALEDGTGVVLGRPDRAAFRLRLAFAGKALDVVLGRADDSEVTLAWSGGRLEARVGSHVAGALEPAVVEDVELEIWVDESIVEVFCDGRALTFRVDPHLDVTPGVVASAGTARCRIASVELVAVRS